MDKPIELSGAELQTTNPRMNMTAVIRALTKIKDSIAHGYVVVITDIEYVAKHLSSIEKWERANWEYYYESDGEIGWHDVKNRDLWEALRDLQKDVNFKVLQIDSCSNPLRKRCKELVKDAAI